LTIAEQEVLTMVLYSRADSWLGWGESRESDNVLQQPGRIFQISMHGLAHVSEPVYRQGQGGQAAARSCVAFRGPHFGDPSACAALLLGGAHQGAQGPGACGCAQLADGQNATEPAAKTGGT
jgi:hypothetical protein